MFNTMFIQMHGYIHTFVYLHMVSVVPWHRGYPATDLHEQLQIHQRSVEVPANLLDGCH